MKESDKKKIGEAYLRLHSHNENEGMTNEEAIKILKQFRDRQGNSSDDIEAFNLAINGLEIELLTDTEQRIFLKAMNRERKVCQLVDDTCIVYVKDSNVSLVEVCDSIKRKVKKIWE